MLTTNNINYLMSIQVVAEIKTMEGTLMEGAGTVGRCSRTSQYLNGGRKEMKRDSWSRGPAVISINISSRVHLVTLVCQRFVLPIPPHFSPPPRLALYPLRASTNLSEIIHPCRSPWPRVKAGDSCDVERQVRQLTARCETSDRATTTALWVLLSSSRFFLSNFSKT